MKNNDPTTLTTDSQGYFYLGGYYGGIYRSKFTLFRFLPKERIKNYYKLPNTITIDSIMIKNKSDSVLIVSDVSSSNSVFQLGSQSFSINPNDSIYFGFYYSPLQIGVDFGKITFYNNSIIDSETVILKGYAGIPVIQIPFQTVSFWEVELGITKDTILIVGNLGVDTLFIDSIRTNNSVFNYDYQNNFISPNDSMLLHLTFTPTSLAYFEANLILYTNNHSSPDSILLRGFGIHPVDVSEQKHKILSFSLAQNYPNPFNPTTKIKYSIPQTSNVVIKVFDVLGNEITTLINEELNAGEYEVEFDGSKLTSGIYFYQLKANSFIETKKMVLMK